MKEYLIPIVLLVGGIAAKKWIPSQGWIGEVTMYVGIGLIVRRAALGVERQLGV